MLIVCNLTPVSRHDFRVGVTHSGYYKEIINTNAEIYGGSGEGNFGGKFSDEIQWNGRQHSISLVLPGLSTLIFKYDTNSS